MCTSSNKYTERNFKIDFLKMDKNAFVNELIATITEELDKSNTSKYICNDGTVISTDVGYVEDWFKEYTDVLRRRYDA